MPALMQKCCTLLSGLLLSASSWALSFPDDWDEDFRDATVVFLPIGIDYRMLKAQCFQESLLQPLAVSHVGAFGLCQFMPGTAAEVGQAIGATPQDFWLPEVSIRAAGYYMGRLHRTWKAPRPLMDRHMLAMASYNAGAGHIIKAQKLCGGPNLYPDIIACLPQVTGRHSEETMTYVERIIYRWYPRLLLQ